MGSFTSWARLANVDALIKLAPTLGATAVLLAAMKLAPLCAGTPRAIYVCSLYEKHIMSDSDSMTF